MTRGPGRSAEDGDLTGGAQLLAGKEEAVVPLRLGGGLGRGPLLWPGRFVLLCFFTVFPISFI
jgi:hypothetical protein